MKYFYNNTLVLSPLNTQTYGDWNCKFDDNSTANPVLHDNRLYTYNGEAIMCNLNMSDWIELGFDNSTVQVWPDTEQVIQWGKEVLRFDY